MDLEVFGMSVWIKPLQKKTSGIILSDDVKGSQQIDKGHIGIVLGVGNGGYNGVELEPLPYKKGDLVAIAPEAVRPFMVGGKAFWRINADAIFAKITDFNIDDYEEVES